MPTLSGDAAISWMRAKGTNVPGACLNTVLQAYGSHPSTGPHVGQYPNAIDGWNYATKRHPGDATPPAGYPVYFDALSRPRYAGDDNYPCGDIVLSLGGGQVICTDGAGAGRIAVMSIQSRARQIGRAYLGWTEDFLGYDVVTTAGAGSGGATPITEGFLMTLNDTEQRQVYEALVVGGPTAQAYYMPQAILNEIRGGITKLLQEARDALVEPSAYSGGFRPIDVLVSQTPAILAAVTKPGAAVAPASGGALTDAEVAAMANAVAERLKAGLGDDVAAALVAKLSALIAPKS